MGQEMSSSAQRVQAALAALGIEARVTELPQSTRTAKDAAAALGCGVAQIAKSLVFRRLDTDRPVLVIASGANRVDESRVSAYLGTAIAKADADFVRSRTGFAIGGVPPVGHATALQTLVDEDLLRLDAVWAAAGTPNAVFRLTPLQLVETTGGQVLSLAERPPGAPEKESSR